MRRLIRTAVNSDPSMTVVSEAADGQDCLDQLKQAAPDIIVMDIEMPVMDGVQAVRAIRSVDRQIPIVMFSSLTSRGAQASFDAIAAGASDFAAKPSGAEHIDQAMAALQRDLVPKLKFWATRRRIQSGFNVRSNPLPQTPQTPPPGHRSTSLGKPANPIKIIAIGASTGGPQALANVLGGLPRELPVPIVITQHMPPVFTGLLAERLADQTGHAVAEAVDGQRLTAGRILIAPGDHHMIVARLGAHSVVKLNRGPLVNSCRPAVDPLFESVARCYGKHALGVILTGMGQDGLRGARQLGKAGGAIYAQDQATSVVWGMPGEVVKHGLADEVLPLGRIAAELNAVLQAARRRVTVAGV
jgi:two-component system chemotaxis response regulator CheB